MRAYLPLVLALGAVAAAACSATTHHVFQTGSTSGGGNNTGPGVGGNGGGLSSTGVGFGGFKGTGGSDAQGSCSADLQSIVDANGNVITMCPSDQGCSGGVCVPACTAASSSQGSIGCDFFAPDPPFYDNGQGSSYDGSCYAVFVANTWGRAAQITVSRAGQTFNMTQFGYIPSGIIPNITYNPVPATGVPPGEVGILFLSHKPGAHHSLGTPLTCPQMPAYVDDAAIPNSGTGSAFHVVSDTPITAYDILPYGGAQSFLPSASLLFPSTAWGTNYYVVAPHPEGMGELWMLIVGAQNGTSVTIATPGNPSPMTVNVDAGQMMQWIGPSSDPTGTILQSTAPIGVFSGSTYLRVSSQTSPGGGGEDSAHQQIPQIKALGSEYVAPNIVTRLASMQPESVPYRLLGVVDGTVLTYDPMPASPQAVPTTLSAGQVAEFETTQLFVVKSQDAMHPFGVTQYMPGAPLGMSRDGCGPNPPFQGLTMCDLGDEDWVNVLPPAQFLQRYVFFTDPTYGTTNLVLTRVKGASGFQDVTVDCLSGPVSGWQNVDSAGKYQVAYVDLVRGAAPIQNCTGSRHEATSKGQFGVTVWGTDWYASYGYPAGGNVGSINNVVVPAIPK